jgi:hypothetical protein
MFSDLWIKKLVSDFQRGKITKIWKSNEDFYWSKISYLLQSTYAISSLKDLTAG